MRVVLCKALDCWSLDVPNAKNKTLGRTLLLRDWLQYYNFIYNSRNEKNEPKSGTKTQMHLFVSYRGSGLKGRLCNSRACVLGYCGMPCCFVVRVVRALVRKFI